MDAMLRQYELVERVLAYDPDADEAMLNRAYVYTVQKHGSQKRASGDPYFSHPVEVAGLMTELKLDQETIVTALLHDTVEDTLATVEEIERLFGPEVARLVDGVTKLSKIETMSDNEAWVMGPGIGRDGYETLAQERDRERAEAVEEKGLAILLMTTCFWCPECEEYTTDASAHLATCELLVARAENEVDRG